MSMDLSTIVPGQAPAPHAGDDCSCCEGVSQETPREIFNRPSLSAVAYRVGSHSGFKESMLARLSSSELPALMDLRTRDDDDFSIALLDGWAMACDVLTFYQERIANELYLRTAVEPRSVHELARLLGYRPRPGVAASTVLAFTLDAAPGAPDQGARPTTIPKGTRVNSVPGPGETPQTFETVEDIEARVEWNALKPRMTLSAQTSNLTPTPDDQLKPSTSGARAADAATPRLQKNSKSAHLQGTDTKLAKGDAILFIETDPNADDQLGESWDIRFVKSVEPDHAAGRTYVEWVAEGTGESLSSVRDDAPNPRLYALRVRASLFGHNAIDPKLLHKKIWKQLDDEIEANGQPGEWKFEIGNLLHLDNDYPAILKGSWLVLSASPQVDSLKSTRRGLFKVEARATQSISKYGLSAKTTCVSLQHIAGAQSSQFVGKAHLMYRRTSVLSASEELALADVPLTAPIASDKLTLDAAADGLQPERPVLVRGKRAQVRVVAVPETPFEKKNPDLQVGQTLTVLGQPKESKSNGKPRRTWRLRAEDGTEHVIEEVNAPFEYVPAGGDAESIAELARVKEVARSGGSSELLFAEPLKAVFDRGSMEILANIARATHGESVTDLLGSGDAGSVFQRFDLRQKPLTHLTAATASGTESTLEIRVNGIRWDEVPTLLGRGPKERIYTTDRDDEGTVSVELGDGLTGARLPTGQNNIVARYRKGIGREGNVAAGQLTMLMDRPLGVGAVVNPFAATGGDDPESIDRVREGTPLSVLTLDRAVSLQDYEDFARGFEAVTKALATWSWDGGQRRVFITVAGPGGDAIPPASATHQNLVKALKTHGDPFVAFAVASYRPAWFRLQLSVIVGAEHRLEKTRGQIEAAMRSAFGFSARSLGQPVHLSEVIGAVHGVAGVVAVDVQAFHRTTPPHNQTIVHSRLPAARPVPAQQGELAAAELLLLDPASLTKGLEVHQ